MLSQDNATENNASSMNAWPSDTRLDQCLALSYKASGRLKHLERSGIATLEQLVSKTEQDLLRVPHVGEKTLSEIKVELNKMNLTLAI